MLKILSRLTGKERPEIIDGSRIYQKAMSQSRNVVFYGDEFCPDSTDGRMEILCLHLSTILFVLRAHGDSGAKLSQAIYDVMIKDFDIALREEGLTDTGVSRRIKPLASMFFARAKTYADAFSSENETQIMLNKAIVTHICNDESTERFVTYVIGFLESLQQKSLGEIAQGKFNFPKFHQ